MLLLLFVFNFVVVAEMVLSICDLADERVLETVLSTLLTILEDDDDDDDDDLDDVECVADDLDGGSTLVSENKAIV